MDGDPVSVEAMTLRDGPRSKRGLILTAAIERFGEVGFEHTKWASIADEVGIGQTALYHYFESKAHCLLTIMRLELAQSLERFTTAIEGIDDPVEALSAAITSALEATPRDALQLGSSRATWICWPRPVSPRKKKPSARRHGRW